MSGQKIIDGLKEAIELVNSLPPKTHCRICFLPDPSNNPYCFCANTFGDIEVNN